MVMKSELIGAPVVALYSETLPIPNKNESMGAGAGRDSVFTYGPHRAYLGGNRCLHDR